MFKNIKKFDFVQLTSYFFPITWFAAILCIIFKISFSIAPRGELEPNALRYNKLLKRMLHTLFLKRIYKSASFVLVTSGQELNYCKPYFNNIEYELIPNYIDMGDVSNMSALDIDLKKGVLYLGRVHPKKGIENLIEAYSMLSSKSMLQHPLTIVGSGDDNYLNKLKEHVKNLKCHKFIKFLGHVQGHEKEILYKTSKVFVLPSFSENFGNVVLESLSFSTPVIASKYTPWEDLEYFQCGFWIDNSPVKIRDKMEKVFTLNNKSYRAICKNSYNFVNEKYSISNNGKTIKSVYEKYMLE